MAHILKLGSGSYSRQRLLKEAGIPFVLVKQDADETQCDWGLPLKQLVESIAIHKMSHVIIPQAQEGDVCFVLTADTLTLDGAGGIHGKPVDSADAYRMLRAIRDNGACAATAFCLDKKVYKRGQWCVEKRITDYAQGDLVFDVPDSWLDRYSDAEDGLTASGGMRIEGFGSLFLKSVTGSYSAIVGLPMFELRVALEKIGFFNL